MVENFRPTSEILLFKVLVVLIGFKQVSKEKKGKRNLFRIFFVTARLASSGTIEVNSFKFGEFLNRII